MSALLERYKKEFVPRFDKDGVTPYLSYKDFDNLNYFDGKFKNSIGVNIAYFAYYYDDFKKDKFILLTPGIGPGHTAYVREIEELAKNGYFVLTLDYCGCDKSEGDKMNSVNEPTRDVLDLINYLRSGKDERLNVIKDLEIVLFGHSLGAYTALNVINLNKDIKKAVIISGFPSLAAELKGVSRAPFSMIFSSILRYEKKTNPEYFNINNFKYLKTTTDKILFIHSLDDRVVPYKATTYKIQKKIKNDNLDFLIIDKKAHNPNYTCEAIRYMQDVFYTYGQLVMEKKLNTLEEKQAYMKSKSVFKMTDQDSEVYDKIFKHIEK